MFAANFAFDAPRSPSQNSSHTATTRPTSRSVSPCSPVGSHPAPRFSVTDLAASFARSRLRPDAQRCYDACEAHAPAYAHASDSDSDWTDARGRRTRTRTRTAGAGAGAPSPSRRSQRQAHARRLCAGDHAPDMAALVARMLRCQDPGPRPSDAASPPPRDGDGERGHDARPRPQPSRGPRAAVRRVRRGGGRLSPADRRAAAAARVGKAVPRTRELGRKRMWSGDGEV